MPFNSFMDEYIVMTSYNGKPHSNEKMNSNYAQQQQ